MTTTWLASGGPWQTASRPIGYALGVLLAALVGYLVLRAYQSPDLLLELANWRLC